MIDLESCEENQRKAIIHQNGNLLVSASAGSGKTRTLIYRIIYLMTTKRIDLGNLLVVTFTDLAANEMKERLQEKLQDSIVESDSEKEQTFLMAQLNKLNSCDISTLHTFCSQTIKKYFYMLDIDPTFTLLSKKESDFLKSRALEKTFDYFSQNNDEVFFALFDAFSKDRKSISFKKNIISISEFLVNKYDYRSWIDIAILNTYNENLNENPLVQYLKKYFSDFFENYSKIFKELYNESVGLNVVDYQEISSTFYSLCDEVSKQNELNKIVSYFDSFGQTKRIMPQKDYANNPDVTSLKVRLQQSKEKFIKALNNIKKVFDRYTIENIDKSLKENKIYIEKILQIVYLYLQKYSEIKNQKNCLDFSDLEYNMLKLLEKQEIREVLKSKYKYIFVDEYQDINDIQESIIHNLENNNLFLVGDVKQSIYGFRHSNPEIFLGKYNLFKNGKGGEVIDLNKNFRSSQSILDFCNFVFDAIMTNNTNGVSYKENARFVFGKKEMESNYEKAKDVQVFAICDIKDKKDKEEKEPLKLYDITNCRVHSDDQENLQRQMQVVIEYINSVKNQSIYDDDLKKYRVTEYKDIAIITRNRKDIIKYVSTYLRKYNIPINATYEYKLYQTYEVNLLINFLKLITNRKLDIELTSVLCSSFVGLTDEQLLAIRSKFYDEDYFYKCVEKYSLIKDEISEKIVKLNEELDEFYKLSNILPISKLIEKIIDKYGYKEYLMLLDEGSARVHNVELFIESIVGENINADLSTYLNYIDNFAFDEEFQVQEKTNENSVTINTIHSSKGLEYGVVILLDAGKSFPQMSTKKEVLLSQNFGLATKDYYFDYREEADSFAKKVLKLDIKYSERKEEMRLLYVALSRAKQKVAIIGNANVEDISNLRNDFEIKECDNYLSLILGALNKNQIADLVENKILTVQMENNTNFEVNVIDKNSIAFDETSFEIVGSVDEIFYEKLKKYLEYNYPNNDSNKITLKNSVSSLMVREDDQDGFEYNIKNFEKFKGDNEVFEKIGNSYHKVLQYIDFNIDCAQELSRALNDMLIKGLISDEEKSLVDEKKLLSCIKTMKQLSSDKKILKEQKFMLYVPYRDVIISDTKDKVLIQGIIDLAIIDDDGVIIVDYKTSRLTENSMKEKYALQLNVYAMAMEKFTGKKIKAKYIYSINMNKLIEMI